MYHFRNLEFKLSDLEFIIHLAFDPVFCIRRKYKKWKNLVEDIPLDLFNLIDLEHTII